jgi:PIN domain nuclease of toxin-antitoxin system
MSSVLDASALLAYLHREPGWQTVQAVIGTACIGTVNWEKGTLPFLVLFSKKQMRNHLL